MDMVSRGGSLCHVWGDSLCHVVCGGGVNVLHYCEWCVVGKSCRVVMMYCDALCHYVFCLSVFVCVCVLL